MDHSEIIELMPAYVDEELSIAETRTIQRHLETCADCRREYDEQAALSKRIRTKTAYFKAPADLADRVTDRLACRVVDRATDHVADRVANYVATTLPQDKPRHNDRTGFAERWNLAWNFGHFNWRQAGTALATLLVAVWSIGLYLNLPSAQERMMDEIVASHVRSLQADHLTDVASTDQHTVKPWFNGRLSFSPPVIDLAAQGFTLEGGRLDYLDGHPVAALIYRHQKHPINLYIWPTNGKDAGPQAETSRGYHLVRWTTDEMNYWAISDVAENDLLKFSGILRLATHQ